MLQGVPDYVALAAVYSLLAGAVVEMLLYGWRVQDSPFAAGLRVQILALPPVMPLLYGLLNPARASTAFREKAAILNLQNWMGPEPSLFHPAWLILLVAAGSAAALLLVSESAWLARQLTRRKELVQGPSSQATARVEEAVRRLAAKGCQVPVVTAVARPELTAYAVGLRSPEIHISSFFVTMLDDEELEAVLAHEVAHVLRRDNWFGWLLFTLRVASFYNPVALFTFHQISHDAERICDAEAAALTGKPLALASALIKVYRATHGPGKRPHRSRAVARRAEVLENRARCTLVEDRVERLVHPEAVGKATYPLFRMALSAGAVLGLAYYVV